MEVSCSSQLYPIFYLLDLNEHLRICNRGAAQLLAAAVSSLCPGVYRLKGRDEPIGFSYDFIFTKPFSEDAFPILEEKIRQLIQEAIPIETLEMVPRNAAELLRHRKCYYPAHFARQSQGTLVNVFQMGEFVDLCPAPYPKSTSEIGVIKLYGLSNRPPVSHRGRKKTVLRIHGCAFSNKTDLKQFLKEKETWLGCDHRALGEKLGLFTLRTKRREDLHEIQTCLWRSLGEEVLHQLACIWRNAYKKREFELIIGPAKDFFQEGNFRFAQLNRNVSHGEVDSDLGLYASKDSFDDRALIFCIRNKLVSEIISSLKFLEKIPKIFGLNAELVFSYNNDDFKQVFEAAFKACAMTPKIDGYARKTRAYFSLIDCFGRRWEGPFLELEHQRNGFRIIESAFGSLQRFIALILESGKKDLSQKKHILSKLKDFNLE